MRECGGGPARAAQLFLRSFPAEAPFLLSLFSRSLSFWLFLAPFDFGPRVPSKRFVSLGKTMLHCVPLSPRPDEWLASTTYCRAASCLGFLYLLARGTAVCCCLRASSTSLHFLLYFFFFCLHTRLMNSVTPAGLECGRGCVLFGTPVVPQSLAT